MLRRDLLISFAASLPVARLLARPPVTSGPLGPFTARENELVLAIAEQILPRTETPGARDARVNEFIAIMVEEWYNDTERARFTAGLEDLDRRSRVEFGDGFLEVSPARQGVLLSGLDAEASALPKADRNADEHFWTAIKSLTLYGYFTSELVQTTVLKTVIRPGRFDPCAPL